MNAAAPLVSVLMPVYNAAPYVEQAVRSILEQTFADFELLIFNDGSQDASSEIIRSIQDERIRFFDCGQNSGYVVHLNEGLRLAKGKYIARMDADDIALPERFAKQVALLEQNVQIGLCGTAYDTFDAMQIKVYVPVSDTEIREFMLLNSPMGHPTVMFRKSIIEQYNLRYDPSFMPAEDYKLWVDFSGVTSIQNIPEVLLHYRVHPYQISSYMNDNQRANADAVRILQLTTKGFDLTPQERLSYCQILHCTIRPETPAQMREMLALMWNIKRQNERLQAYDAAWFNRLFAKAWREAVTGVQHYTLGHLQPTLLQAKPMPNPFGLSDTLRIIVKSLLGWEAKHEAANLANSVL
ncbi:glycosyltransferase family 2 protein [Hymenobacter terricola]|uniref:glycosyltransferase family 2 protein n=1 Tax=Hymenobacter terricola TaxID=2819236 RepID=UPI001CF30999|nr:glycosyltransferase [Hymenobacter terricola]